MAIPDEAKKLEEAKKLVEAKNLVSTSGNKFHAEVACWMQADGWKITVSPYYMDQTQSKAREIDLVAEQSWSDVTIRLFIECKYIPPPRCSVFWFADKNVKAAKKLVCSRGMFSSLRAHEVVKHHHYLVQSQKQVAKLFATTNTGKQDGMEHDPYYKALNHTRH